MGLVRCHEFRQRVQISAAKAHLGSVRLSCLSRIGETTISGCLVLKVDRHTFVAVETASIPTQALTQLGKGLGILLLVRSFPKSTIVAWRLERVSRDSWIR